MPFAHILARRSATPSLLRFSTARSVLSTMPAFTRSMASTPDSSHVSEHTVQVPQGTTSQDAHGAHHEDHYDPPTGWLWGVRPGEKYQNEGWEGVWTYGFYGSLVVAAIAYAGKPDSNIETWALEEAKRRLQIEGILAEDSEQGVTPGRSPGGGL